MEGKEIRPWILGGLSCLCAAVCLGLTILSVVTACMTSGDAGMGIGISAFIGLVLSAVGLVLVICIRKQRKAVSVLFYIGLLLNLALFVTLISVLVAGLM